MNKLIRIALFSLSFNIISFSAFANSEILVFQSDFGLNDGAVSAMKGVAVGVDKNLKIYDVTHEIPAYNIWDAAYRLYQTTEYWPKGTVFVSIVDPGVGSERLSVVLKTKSGHYFVTPDNGTLTLVAEKFGIDEIREIDEAVNRLKNSEKSYTFHGRDVYAYTGAKLAAGKIQFNEVGKKLNNEVIKIDYQKPTISDHSLLGNIPALDVRYGNIWTNIDRKTASKLNISYGERFNVKIYHDNKLIFNDEIPFAESFSGVNEGENMMYYNSLDSLSFAINMGNFADKYNIQHGNNWTVKIEPINKK